MMMSKVTEPLKISWIFTGFAGGFFIELILMWLTEKLVGHLTRSDGAKEKFMMFISFRNMVTLLVLTMAALCSVQVMLSVGAGSLLYIYIYFIIKGIRAENTVCRQRGDKA